MLNPGVDPCAGVEPNIDEPSGCDVFVVKERMIQKRM
jgi:hypothetical protein